MMIHPQITEELIEFNKGNLDKQYFCKEISKPGYDVFTQLLDPRFLKTHIPLSLFPKILDSGCKVRKIFHFVPFQKKKNQNE